MAEKLRPLIIGSFVIVAFGIITATLLFLKPSFGDGGLEFRVRFVNIEKIGVGTRITLAGKPVGQIKEIMMVHDARTISEPSNINPESVYSYELTLSIDSKTPIYHSDLILAQTTGLLGERTIAIIPQKNHTGLIPICKGELLYSTPAPSVEDAMGHLGRLAATADASLNGLSQLIELSSPKVGSAIANIADASQTFKDLLIQCEEAKLISNLSAAAQKATSTMSEIESIAQHVARGEGSLGKLLMKEDLTLELNQTMARVNVLLSDINNYGLLFHSNSTWKQQRAYQMDNLVRLKQPEAFQRFWKDQLYSVHVQLGQLTSMLEVARQKSQPVTRDPRFKQAINQTMSELNDLKDQLSFFESRLSLDLDKDTIEPAGSSPSTDK